MKKTVNFEQNNNKNKRKIKLAAMESVRQKQLGVLKETPNLSNRCEVNNETKSADSS